MIVEYIRYRVPTDPAAFEAAYARACTSLREAPQCLAYELTRCEEAPDHYILRIEWLSTEAHLQGFRHGPQFGPFLSEIRPYVAQIEEMRHYAPTGLTWRRDA